MRLPSKSVDGWRTHGLVLVVLNMCVIKISEVISSGLVHGAPRPKNTVCLTHLPSPLGAVGLLQSQSQKTAQLLFPAWAAYYSMLIDANEVPIHANRH